MHYFVTSDIVLTIQIGFIHQGSGRDRRIKAGLRYSKGGQKKYWLPMPADVTERNGTSSRAIRPLGGDEDDEEVYAPLLEDQAAAVVHDAYNVRQEKALAERRGFEIPFSDPDPEEETLYEHSRKYLFGDYLYPCIDVSSEYARQTMWNEEERILRDERGAYYSPLRSTVALLPGEKRRSGYGAVKAPALNRTHSSTSSNNDAHSSQKGKGKARNSQNMHESPWFNNGSVIDKLDNEIPPPAGGVRLGWTKHSRRVASPKVQHIAKSISPLASSSSDRSTPESPRNVSRIKNLPTDAVDLVVKNESLAEEEIEHERRKGEPAVRGSGWRKAFTQGHFIPDAKIEKEHIPVGEDVEPTSNVERYPSAWRDNTVIEIEDSGVARASTPPAHAQVPASGFPPHEENPWA